MDSNMPPGSMLVLDRHEGRVRWRVRLPAFESHAPREAAPPPTYPTAPPPSTIRDELAERDRYVPMDHLVQRVADFVKYRFGDAANVNEERLREELEAYVRATSNPPEPRTRDDL